MGDLVGALRVDTSSYAVWSENNHTNTNIILETNKWSKSAKFWLNLFLGYDRCKEKVMVK
jgi:hypothetical protein